ncbi:MAG: hypothetical protein A3J65_04150 [Candidatus Buchananbacteria bacterium RIFCSPHIGHO2_02_FULL_45_11b]|uniref:Uncharacterized protein n=2 Tax=Candidatus Buchananiibacteriota TaxID=1817903 RepID=A0A1G1YLR4_9BACT|nr:MAG: hypothetical protein A3J65_04150 [Candidatus Buchananbacteria bacterium RIFCSPHIGHO2_02_FULL_45_11b]OGY57197.1 MAG: hypothetical protein A3H67_04935 [Candidatus Buchananbacteria bacterium RIFCSPLOWO2_02_FULL_46_11b]
MKIRKAEKDQVKDPVTEGIREATADILERLSQGFLVGVRPIEKDLPEVKKPIEPDLGQGRKFIRPLGELLRKAMAQVDKEDEEKINPQNGNSPPE